MVSKQNLQSPNKRQLHEIAAWIGQTVVTGDEVTAVTKDAQKAFPQLDICPRIVKKLCREMEVELNDSRKHSPVSLALSGVTELRPIVESSEARITKLERIVFSVVDQVEKISKGDWDPQWSLDGLCNQQLPGEFLEIQTPEQKLVDFGESFPVLRSQKAFANWLRSRGIKMGRNSRNLISAWEKEGMPIKMGRMKTLGLAAQVGHYPTKQSLAWLREHHPEVFNGCA